VGVEEEEQKACALPALSKLRHLKKTSNSTPMAVLTHFNAILIGVVKICVYWGPY
jgi:hypothetical protein